MDVGEDVPLFVESVYGLSARAGIRHVFSVMNSWLVGQRFDLCDEALRTADVERLSIDHALAFLTITNGAHLRDRQGFYDRVRQKIVNARGEEVAARLTDGLRNEDEGYKS